MLRFSKRRFVQLAGISIANRVLPSWASQARPKDSDRKLILVTFGGGVRYSETFTPEGERNIPRLVELRPSGHFYKTCVNSGVLSHFNSTASIVTGNWQRVDDFGFQPPAGPTLFELYRQQTGAPATDAWVVATNKSFSAMGWGGDREYGMPYGAN